MSITPRSAHSRSPQAQSHCRLLHSYHVCVIGGGNIAHATAGWISSKEKAVCVRVLTRQPERWNKQIVVSTCPKCKWKDMKSFKANIHMVSSEPQDVIPVADIIFLAVPVNAHIEVLNAIKCYVKPGAIIGTLFGQGMFDRAVQFVFGEEFYKLQAIFAFQHVPWLARTVEYGQEVKLLGPKDFLSVAVLPKSAEPQVCGVLQNLFDQKCQFVPNFLSITMTPSNQIIHPAQYYAIFKEYDGKRALTQDEIQWGLYEDKTGVGTYWLEQLDAELQTIKYCLTKQFPTLDLSHVMPLKERIILQYGSDVRDKTNLRTVLTTNSGYSGCNTPVAAVAGGYAPAVSHRLFQEDIPYGLCVLKGIAELVEKETPAIDFLIQWHQKWMDKKFLIGNKLNELYVHETAAPARYGIRTVEDLVKPSLV